MNEPEGKFTMSPINTHAHDFEDVIRDIAAKQVASTMHTLAVEKKHVLINFNGETLSSDQ